MTIDRTAELDELVRRADPAQGVPVPSPTSAGGRWRYVQLTRTAPAACRRHHRRRAAAVGVGIAMPLGAALVVLGLVVVPGTNQPPSAAAATFTRLSLTAATMPTTLGPGQYYYTEVEGPTNVVGVGTSPGHSFDEYLDGTVQTWVAADGSGRVVTTTDPTPRFPTAADQAAWVAAGSPPAPVPPSQLTTTQQLGPNTGSEVNGPIPLYDVSGLPTSPTVLAQVLSNGEKSGNNVASLPKGISSLDYISNCDTQSCALFERAVSLLQGPDMGVTPALRAALYQVLATVPGVTLLGPTTDPHDRTGIGVAYVAHQLGGTGTLICSDAPPNPGGVTPAPGSGDVIHFPPAKDVPTTPSPGVANSTTVTYKVPPSTTTFTVVINPQSATILSSEESSSPLVRPDPPSCSANSASTVNATPSELEVPPTWRVVLAQGIVGSDTAVPQGG